MKYQCLLVIVLTLFAAKAFAQQDGPYVFYADGKAVIRSVVAGQGMASIDVSAIKVQFNEHPEWDFSVKLKDILENEPCEFEAPEKLLFLSDIEGEFEAFRNLLLSNHVIDEKYNWTFGKGHLVICGDLFDRGLNVPEYLWLLYKLEQDAKSKGGYVHTILGNHDIMNLSGDLRYVQAKYFESAKIMGVDYMQLYDKNTELGRWLRTKNTIEKIGDNLCAHAGVAPQINVLKMSLEDINTKCRPYYDKAKTMQGVADPEVTKFFEGNTSLFWYRGYFMEPKATEAEVDETLRLYDCKRIIVGHTIVPGNVGFYYGGKVLGLDVNEHEGQHEAALFEKGKWWKVNGKGEKGEIARLP